MIKNIFKPKIYRQLTSGEINMLQSIFQDAIDYNEVKIYNASYLPFGMQNKDIAMSPNGNIYFDSKHFVDDFSIATNAFKIWFIHEMTHVWQHSMGFNILLNGFMTAITGKYYNQKVYCYQNCETLGFNKLSFEQQAEIVSHYYGAKFLNYKQYINSLPYYESILKEFLLNPKDKNLLPY